MFDIKNITCKSPICYICSPFRGKTLDEQKQNIENVKIYGRYALSKGYVPYIPHLAICSFLDDEILEERNIGIIADFVMLSVCQELWVFGDVISSGMQKEIENAKTIKLPIRYINTDDILKAT